MIAFPDLFSSLRYLLMKSELYSAFDLQENISENILHAQQMFDKSFSYLHVSRWDYVTFFFTFCSACRPLTFTEWSQNVIFPILSFKISCEYP